VSGKRKNAEDRLRPAPLAYALPTKSLLSAGTGRPNFRFDSMALGSMTLNTLGLQDVFEPYYEGRKNSFATIDPKAVDKARKAKERLEEMRKAERGKPRDEAA
jgi:hypothetical protein